MDIISLYCLEMATDEVASLQVQTPHYTTVVSMEGSDQLSSESIPHLVQCTRQYCTALCDSVALLV